MASLGTTPSLISGKLDCKANRQLKNEILIDRYHHLSPGDWCKLSVRDDESLPVKRARHKLMG